jgi:hypothetical protein
MFGYSAVWALMRVTIGHHRAGVPAFDARAAASNAYPLLEDNLQEKSKLPTNFRPHSVVE